MPKAKHQITDEERSRRFIEKVRELGVDTEEAVEESDRALRRIVKPNEPPKRAARRPPAR